MKIELRYLAGFFRRRGILIFMHLVILALSVWLIAMISIDSFNKEPFYQEPKFQKREFWICIFFLADFFIELALSQHKWRYIRSHFIFLLVSIPYQALLYEHGWLLSNQAAYLIRYIPLIRSGYALAIVVSWFTYNRATGLFFTYIIILLSTIYFASLTFFLFEFKVNPKVHVYTDALWWACMDVTTVGSNIEAVTGVGKVLAVLLAALGMMMFPIFTVYVTNLVTQRSQQSSAEQRDDTVALITAYKNYVNSHKNAQDASGPSDSK